MNFHQVVTTFLGFVSALANFLLAAVGAADGWVRDRLTALGVDQRIQTVILIVVAFLVLLAALRVMGGIVRILIVVLIVLFAIHVLLPTIHV